MSSRSESLYGQKITNETPDLRASSLLHMNKILEELPAEKKTAWTTAMEKCPELCGEPFKLMFLRCSDFNCYAAAKRLVAYWNKRVELFTPSKAFLPMVLGENSAMKDDEKSLKVGFLRLVNKTDNGGRSILFVNPSRIPEEFDRTSMVRAFWYHIHVVLGSEDTQKQGVVVVAYPKNVKFSQFDRQLARMNIESIKGYLPIRVSAFHICRPPAFFRIIFSVVKIFMGEKLRKRVKIHTGSDDEVLAKLENKYGISRQNLPTDMNGSVFLDQEKWLQKQQEAGL